jgi:hypothetical protein
MNFLTSHIIRRDAILVSFHPYTTFVTYVLMKSPTNPSEHGYDKALISMCEEILELAEARGCRQDNKIAIGIQIPTDPTSQSGKLFIGFYDNKWSIGLGIFQPDSTTRKCNIYFNP